MKKYLLAFTLLVAGAMLTWAQEPVLTLLKNQIGTYPYELDETSTNTVVGLDDLTIAVQIDAPANVSGRRALFAISDPTQEKNSGAEGKNSRYVAYGMNGRDAGYLASWRDGDRFTGGGGIEANKRHIMVVYVINPTANTFKAYLNGSQKYSKVNAHTDGFMSGYEIATPKVVKTAHPNAKIYIGGGKHSGGNGEVFQGLIRSVRVYSGALTEDAIAQITPIYDMEEEVSLLDAAITKAETLLDYIGEGLGKYSAPDYETKLAEIEEFRNNIGNTTTPEAVITKTSEVETLIASVQLNIPENGKFYRLKNNASSWYASSDLRTDETDHNDKLYMKEDGTTASTIWYLTADNKLLSFTKGQYLGDMSSDWAFEAVGSNGNVVTFNKSAVLGKYQILPSSGRALYGDNQRVDAAGSGNNSGNYAWIIEEVTSLPVAITSAGYATFYCPVAVSLPAEGLKAYYVSETTGSYAKMEEITGVIPANTGVILEGEADTYDLTIGGEAESVTNKLRGTVASEYITDDAYVLSMPTINDEVQPIGFYKATKNQNGNTAFLNNGFKAYLPADGNNARSLVFDFGTETGIESIEGENGSVKTEIYDLAGRRVQNAQKGLYIVNGKKVIK